MLSVLPYRVDLPLKVSYLDKIAHFFEYAVLAMLLERSIYRMGRFSVCKTALFALILSSGYGIVMELVQRYIPGRSAELYDVVFNTIGVTCGIILGEMTIWRKK